MFTQFFAEGPLALFFASRPVLRPRCWIACLAGALFFAGTANGALLEFRLEATNAAGVSIDRIVEGEILTLSAYVKDLRSGSSAKGVFSAYADVIYSAEHFMAAGSILHAQPFVNLATGDAARPGIINAAGAFTLTSTGASSAKVFSVSLRAIAPGTVTLSGRLDESIDNQFALFGNGGGLLANADISWVSKQIRVIQRIPGDVNADGLVGILDFGRFRSAFGNYAACPNCDFNGDRKVDLRDFGIFRQNFGRAAPLPEPRWLSALLLGFLAAFPARLRNAR